MGIEQIETEFEKLDQKIEELIDTEQQLLNKISATFYLWKQKNEEKQERIKILERKCEELAEFLVDMSTHS
jgi:formiminotetrahydrofolate cyclodeaminase